MAIDLMARVPQAVQTAQITATRRSNALYSNLLEGQEGVDYITAHESAEVVMDATGAGGVQALGSAVLMRCHHELFSTGDSVSFGAGQLRSQHVKVQRHVPPNYESLRAFLARADHVYLLPQKSAEELLIRVAAAHHRMTWIHPFRDGNGRAIRLQSQLALRPFGSQYWSLSAGLWRRRDDYFRFLAEADEHRLGDLDGRGNLSEKRLVAWCEFFISVVDEEVHAVASQLQLDLK
ncbi:MAG: Fic family protein [Hylemonella sp.]|uniref:Fic family protein n=1 Tax=Hylemonella sp. TaxID=2066020 RepID=UPI003919A15F